MKHIIYFLLILLLNSCVGKSNSKSAIETEGTKTDKNVLFIVIDDLNTSLGCYGHPIVQSPHIDKLASTGVKFENAYCNYAVCNPSRASFLSGLKPETTTILDNRTGFQSVLANRLTLPGLFKQNGFYTMSLGKIFHNTQEKNNDLKAWDEIYDFKDTELGKMGAGRNITDGTLKWCSWRAAEGDDEDQPDGQIAKKAVEFIKQKKEQPFFLAVGFKKPHDPFVAPKKYFDMYPLEVCNPPILPENWEPVYPYSLPGQTKVFNKFNENDKREFLRSYYACISFMDAQVGKLLDALKETGQLDNTLIVFFGDHGYHLGEHNWWNKVTLYQKGTNAPFIMAGQSVGKKGISSKSMFEYIDIYPTLASLFNLKDTPSDLEGKSFVEVVNDPEKPFRSEVHAVIKRGDILGHMIKNKDYRYIEWDNGNKGIELYDQRNDPIEYNNLAEEPEYETVISTMKTLLNQY